MTIPTGEGLEFEKIIERIGVILSSHRQLNYITPILSAKVPIVRFRYSLSANQSVECDISLYNILARYNTQLLRAYTLIDQRVQVLGFVVKHFAKVIIKLIIFNQFLTKLLSILTRRAKSGTPLVAAFPLMPIV